MLSAVGLLTVFASSLVAADDKLQGTESAGGVVTGSVEETDWGTACVD